MSLSPRTRPGYEILRFKTRTKTVQGELPRCVVWVGLECTGKDLVQGPCFRDFKRRVYRQLQSFQTFVPSPTNLGCTLGKPPSV